MSLANRRVCHRHGDIYKPFQHCDVVWYGTLYSECGAGWHAKVVWVFGTYCLVETKRRSSFKHVSGREDNVNRRLFPTNPKLQFIV